MAKKTKTKRRRRSGFGGGGRWGINMSQAAMGASSQWVGRQVLGLLPAQTPAVIRNAPLGDLGLYVLGVVFRDKSARSFGAGGVIGASMAAALPAGAP